MESLLPNTCAECCGAAIAVASLSRQVPTMKLRRHPRPVRLVMVWTIQFRLDDMTDLAFGRCHFPDNRAIKRHTKKTLDAVLSNGSFG